MTEARNTEPGRADGPGRSGRYDLEDRTREFARRVRAFVTQLPKTIANIEDVKQLVRSSGSAGANYIEANEALSKRDFAFRIKICRKESKESWYWLRLLDTGDDVELDSQPAASMFQRIKDWFLSHLPIAREM